MTDRASTVRATRNVISGDFFTPAYRITGKIAVGNTGLIGLLNDSTTSLAELEDIYLSRVSQPARSSRASPSRASPKSVLNSSCSTAAKTPARWSAPSASSPQNYDHAPLAHR